MITVFIADDHLIFRQGLRTLLTKTEGIDVVGEANDGLETLRNIEKLKQNVAVLDVTMPGLDGIEVTKRIKKLIPDTQVVMLSMHADNYFAIEALKAGASGYLLKEESLSQLVDAIRAVNKRDIFVSPTLETPIMRDFVHMARQVTNNQTSILTDREREILQLIAEGMTNQKIADLLCISINTVDTHRKNIMSKLNIHSIAGLVKYAIKHKIVTV